MSDGSVRRRRNDPRTYKKYETAEDDGSVLAFCRALLAVCGFSVQSLNGSWTRYSESLFPRCSQPVYIAIQLIVQTMLPKKSMSHAITPPGAGLLLLNPEKHNPIWPLEGHTGSVTALAFSPGGDRLASGSEDGSIIIWEPLTASLQYQVVLPSTITCLVWDSTRLSRLFLGCTDGTLAVLENFEKQEPGDSVLTGIKVSICALAINSYTGHIAVVAGSEIHLAKEVAPSLVSIHRKYATFKIFPSPSELLNTPEQADKWVRGTALAYKDNGNEIVVAYLNHGVVCWDIGTLNQLWRINPIHSHHLIHTTLFPDENLILISNLCDSIDLYKKGQSHPTLRLKNLPISTDRNVPLQVACLPGGNEVISGSSNGKVHIWDISSGKTLQLLEHQGHLVQVIATFEYPSCIVITTSTSRTTLDTSIHIWKTRKHNGQRVSILTVLTLFVGNFVFVCFLHSEVLDNIWDIIVSFLATQHIQIVGYGSQFVAASRLKALSVIELLHEYLREGGQIQQPDPFGGGQGQGTIVGHLGGSILTHEGTKGHLSHQVPPPNQHAVSAIRTPGARHKWLKGFCMHKVLKAEDVIIEKGILDADIIPFFQERFPLSAVDGQQRTCELSLASGGGGSMITPERQGQIVGNMDSGEPESIVKRARAPQGPGIVTPERQEQKLQNLDVMMGRYISRDVD
ncbi:WD40 repeat-like protein [Paxillus ammoniavirescens]|nr:WD40 repeat-like protein [Paxillus ammoniavirescens]